MAGQERVQHTSRGSEADVESDDVQAPQAGASDRDAQVDSILDEIDSVLEVNAEDFVKSFVQKGGQ